MRWTMFDLLFVGVGWTDLAITLNRMAVGAFFMLSGYHKLFNAERHRLIVDELKALGVPASRPAMTTVCAFETFERRLKSR
jgi:uncharacterized membrane protein YphA (DoxX/SURF4 family)